MRLAFVFSIFSIYSFLARPFEEAPAPKPVSTIEKAAIVSHVPAETRTLEFVENKGQWPQQVRFAADLPGGKMFLQPNGFTYVLHDPVALRARLSHTTAQHHATAAAPSTDELKGHAYSVIFEGAQSSPVVQGLEETEGIRNYFLGSNPSRWGSGAKGYRQIYYKSLYQGVDMALYEQAGQLKYDLHVAAGASPDQIKLRYTGTSSLKLKNGNLVIETSVGQVTEQRPLVYQVLNGYRVNVPCVYKLEGQVLRFQFPQGYNRHAPLVIDPVVIFSSFTGSTSDNWGFTATYDSQGNMYSGGIAFGTGYPASRGAFKTTFSGVVDIAIIKYKTDVSGNAARLYATYVGGNNTEMPQSMVVNSQDQLLILSSVGSDDFPTSQTALERSFKGGPPAIPVGINGPQYPQGSDIAITTFSPDGRTLVASTFLGGTNNDGLMNRFSGPPNPLIHNYGDQFRGDIITDLDNNVYIASNTASIDFPAMNGFRSRSYGGALDAVICKLSPSLDRVIWGNYYGGPDLDAAYSIQLDKDRNVYIAGGTTSSVLPETAGGLHPNAFGGVDGFVLKINNTGNQIIAATFLGTDAYDQAYFLQLDIDANVYLCGQTLGNYPVSSGVFSTPFGKQFIHKLTTNLSTSLFSTVFGSDGSGEVSISPTAFLVDECERIYVSGWGGSGNYTASSTQNLPTTNDAIQSTTDGSDFYLMQLAPNATELVYATFYGGNGSNEHVDGGTSRFDQRGFIYQAVCGGCSGTNNFPIPPGAHSYSRENNSPNCNNAAFKFDFQVVIPNAGSDKQVCADDPPIILSGSPAGGIWSGKGVSFTPSINQYTFTPSAVPAGNTTLTYTIPTGLCTRASTMVITVGADVPHTIALPGLICVNNAAIPLAGQPVGGTFSGPGVVHDTFVPAVAGVGIHTITYTSNGSNGFCGTTTQTLEVAPLPPVTVRPDTILCPGSITPFQLKGSPAGGTWSGNYVSPSGLFTPPPGFTGSEQVTYTVTATSTCSNSANQQISVAPVPVFKAALSNALCFSNPVITGYAPYTAIFTNATTNANQFLWTFGNGQQSTEREPRFEYTQPGTYTVNLTAYYGNDCQVQKEIIQIVVENNFIPNIITPNGDGMNETFIQRFSCLPTELTVYNRWGKQVYHEKIYTQTWGGGTLSDGTYYFLLKDEAGKTAKGWVEIAR